MSRAMRGYTPKKWGLNKSAKRLKETTHNKEYKIVNKLRGRDGGGIDCMICMGKCGYGPYRANKWKRNCGKKPRYKDIDRKSVKDFNVGS